MVWYYVKDGARQGPVEEGELSRLAGQGAVRPDTLVWSEGMSDWRPYSTVTLSAPGYPPAGPPVTAEIRTEPRVEATPEAVLQASPEPAPAQAFAPENAATAPANPVAAAPALFCTQCGRQYPSEEMVRFGAATVCANCKDIYAQRLRETGQVSGARVYGGFWIRFLAVIIDSIALWIVNFALQTVTGTRITNPRDLGLIMGSIGLNFFISIALGMIYESFFLVQYGATPGKMVLKLKVITPDGGGLTWGRAIGRHFAKYLSGITLAIGYIMAGFDMEKRALHDYIAGTRVIRTA
jgi:uncharacterized RDD family membrane protein YckC